MNELVSFFEHNKGIESLTPEQTVACISCFMHDEETLSVAAQAGISVASAQQCLDDLWNIFSYRKWVISHAA